MVPTKKTTREYTTLEEIQARKDELLEQIQADTTQASALWNQVFVKREDTTKGDYIASLINNGLTVLDLFLVYRKLRRGYGGLFGKKKRSRR